MTNNQPMPGAGNGSQPYGAPYQSAQPIMQNPQMQNPQMQNPQGMPGQYPQQQFQQPLGQNGPQGQPAPEPGKPKKPWYKKWWVWLIVVILIIGIASSGKSGNKGSTTAASSSSSASQSTSSTSASSASGSMDTEGDLGNYHVKIVSATKSTADYQGKDTIIVTYEWTNNSDSATSFAAALNAHVYQNGVGLDVAIYTDIPQGYDVNSELTSVQAGATQDVTIAYTLSDTSDVTVEVTDLLTISGAKVAHTYSLS